nr:unnamed protein product [Callosobruchus chinensis]
MKLARSTRTL